MNPTTSELDTIKHELAALRSEVDTTKRRLRTVYALAVLGVCVAFTGAWHKEAIAQGYTMTLAQAAARITALETKTASISTLTLDNQPTVRFSGVNVQIVSGSGGTEGPVNGRGNLIVGYNEIDNPALRSHTGSHNIVTGTFQSYSSYGGFVLGVYSTVSAPFASVTGGQGNTASGSSSSVTGGVNNQASGILATVTGGSDNIASGIGSSISGGSYLRNGAVVGWGAGGFYTAESPGFGVYHHP